jgi:membrane-associated phospholipid phosphatase
MQKLEKVFDQIGNYSPLLYAIITLFSISNNYKLIIIFIIGYISNNYYNIFLKDYFFKKFNKDTNNDTPSGHFQKISYCLLFYYLNNKKINIIYIILYLLLCSILLYNCIHYKYHTIIDIITGILIGFSFCYSYSYIYKLFI